MRRLLITILTRFFVNNTPCLLADYEERPKEDQSSHKEFSGISITNDETTRKEQNHPKDERRTSAGKLPLSDNPITLVFVNSTPRLSAAYEERPKEDEKSHKGFAGMRIGNDEPKRSHPKDERRKSAGAMPLNNNPNSYFC